MTYINGVETRRSILSETMLRMPVTEIVGVGSAEIPEEEPADKPVIGDGYIILPTGEVLTYTRSMFAGATAYTCVGYTGRTATGTEARVGAIAVDPSVIPYGTRMFIITNDGEYVYGIATAEDCGSKQFIYGTRIDLHYDTRAECRQFGARMCWVYFLC